MRKGVVGRGVVTSLIILLIASFSIGIVMAEDGTLEGDSLTLTGDFAKNNTYELILGDIFQSNFTGDDGKLVVDLKKEISSNSSTILKSKSSFIVTVTNLSSSDKKPIEFIVNNSNFETSLQTSLPSERERTPTSTPTTPPPQENKPKNNEGEGLGIFDKIPGGISIGIVILLVIILILSLHLGYLDFIFKKDEEPRRLSQVPDHEIQDNYKLTIELNDGTARIPDRTIIVTNKNDTPLSSTKSDLNGSYIINLPKGTYNIYVKGGENYEDNSKKIKLSDDKSSIITLVKKQYLQVEVVDESGKPISGIYVRVKESGSGVDAIGNSDTDANGIARFTLSRNKKYTASINILTQDYTIPGSIEITSSDTLKKFVLKRKEGMLEITVTEQAKGQIFAGIPVISVKKGTNQVLEFISDGNGMIKQRVAVGDYTIKIKPGASQLYEAIEKQVNVPENKLVPVTLDLRFSYKPSNQTLTEIKKHYEKLNNSFKEVSAYDRCIPLFFKSTGERPLKLIERIINRPVEFLGSRTTPDEIINHILSAEEIISEEISRIMREKSNVDFYFSIQNLQQMDELTVSDYSQEKFNELVRDISNYHKNHFREIGNKLHDIDIEITDLSRSLTIQPVADLWRTAQKLQENCNNEPDAKKKGVMLFINDKLLDHVREMYTREEVKERLKFSLL